MGHYYFTVIEFKIEKANDNPGNAVRYRSEIKVRTYMCVYIRMWITLYVCTFIIMLLNPPIILSRNFF